MKNATLLPHKLIAIPVATLFLFQIAMLATPMNDGLGRLTCRGNVGKDVHTKNYQ